jgi:hypothetical protein
VGGVTEELKSRLPELEKRDSRALTVLERVRYTLEDVERALKTVESEYREARGSKGGFERDFYDFVLFSVIRAAVHVKSARRRVQDALDAYKGRGAYWEDY